MKPEWLAIPVGVAMYLHFGMVGTALLYCFGGLLAWAILSEAA